MSISLRIVGIFYSQDKIPYTPNMTVKDVLDYAKSSPSSDATAFGYINNKDSLTNGGDSVVAFAARYPNSVISETSSTVYESGDYFLSESVVGSPRYSV